MVLGSSGVGMYLQCGEMCIAKHIIRDEHLAPFVSLHSPVRGSEVQMAKIKNTKIDKERNLND